MFLLAAKEVPKPLASFMNASEAPLLVLMIVLLDSELAIIVLGRVGLGNNFSIEPFYQQFKVKI